MCVIVRHNFVTREIYRQTNWQKERQTERETERQTDRKKERQTDSIYKM